ncbi:LOW QUALITY PROTEIN: hypothetical protein HID58_039852, partial [Brassica napus]
GDEGDPGEEVAELIAAAVADVRESYGFELVHLGWVDPEESLSFFVFSLDGNVDEKERARRDGGRDTRRSGSIIASGVARHSSDSSPDTKLVDKTVEGVDIISCMPHEIIHYMFGASQWKLYAAWRHVWCHTPCLDFDCFNKYGHWAQLKAPDINQTLRSYRAPKITRFHLQTGVLKMLAKLQNAERLSFGGSLFQILSLAELRGVSFPTFKVQTLTLKTRFAKSFVPGITRLLHNSPGLKKLIDWYLDNYLNSQGLNPDQCWRSKYDVFPTSDESDMIVRNEASLWELVVSFVEMVLKNYIGPESKAAAQLVRVDGIVDVILRHLKKSDEEIAMEIAWIIVYLSALSDIATRMLLKGGILQLLVERLATSDSLQLLIPVLRSLGNFVSVDPKAMLTILIGGKNTEESVIGVLAKCLRSDHRVLKKEAAWVCGGSIEHKRMIHSTEAMPLLIELLSTSPFDIRKEVAYVLGNLCVESAEGDTKPRIIQEHLVSIVSGGCLPGFINLVRSPDIEAARLGLQFIELVLRGMPNGEGSKIVEGEDGIDAMQRFQFHENEELRVMANSLVDKYFGEDYGINE